MKILLITRSILGHLDSSEEIARTIWGWRAQSRLVWSAQVAYVIPIPTCLTQRLTGSRSCRRSGRPAWLSIYDGNLHPSAYYVKSELQEGVYGTWVILWSISDFTKTFFAYCLFFFRSLTFICKGRFFRYLFLPLFKGHFRSPLGFGRNPQPWYTRSASGPTTSLSVAIISSSFRRQSGQIVSPVKKDIALSSLRSLSHRSQNGWMK